MRTLTTLQIFIYNLTEHGINEYNRYPLLRFSSHSDKYTFISKLKSNPERMNQPYFVINNPQLLPTALRAKHQYPISNAQTPETSTLEPNYFIDGVFYFTEENIELLRECDIDNNASSNSESSNNESSNNESSDKGFREFMENI